MWINGPFGVGKSTAAGIVTARTAWRTFDPEDVGYLLAGSMQDLNFEDFQDLAPWRTLVPAVADEIFRYTNSEAMVAVQTVLVEHYWAELATGLAQRGLALFHVVVDCHDLELRRRIEADEINTRARAWRLDHIASFQAARNWLVRSADLVLDTTDLTPEIVADELIKAATHAMATAPSVP